MAPSALRTTFPLMSIPPTLTVLTILPLFTV